MSNLTTEQLRKFTDEVNERFAEFDGTLMGDPMTLGKARIAWDVFRQLDDETRFELRLAEFQRGYESALANMRIDREEREAERTFRLVLDANGRKVERVPWEADKPGDVPYTNGDLTPSVPSVVTDVRGILADDPDALDPATLADAWPDMPNLTDGVDRFAEHPIAGEPPPIIEPIRIPSPKVAATLGPEHTVVTPLRSKPPDPDIAREKVAHAIAQGSGALVEAIRKPRTLAEVDEAEQAKGRGGNVLPTLEQILKELRRISMGGVMPSMSQFNDARPANWATAQAQTMRLDTSWGQLAKLAELRLRGGSE